MKIEKSTLKWIPAALWGLTILILTIESNQVIAPPFPMWDKLAHAGAFAVLSLLLAWPEHKRPIWFWIVFMPMVYGAVIELAQMQIPHRKGDLLDWGADSLGSALVFAIIIFIRRYNSNRKP